MIADSCAHVRKRTAFTLIELLVVIAIVVVLASTLLPVISNVKERANRVGCTANLKQLGVAMQSYVNDKGIYPSSSDQSEDLWFDSALPKYVGYSSYVINGTIWRCPTDRALYKASAITDRTYGMNSSMTHIRPSMISHLSKTSLLADGTKTTNATTPYWYWEIRTYSQKDFLHGGGVNVLFADMHVEWRQPSEIPTSKQDPFWKPF